MKVYRYNPNKLGDRLAGIYNPAKVWVSHSEYTTSEKSSAGEIFTIWGCRYERGILKKWKVWEFGFVYCEKSGFPKSIVSDELSLN